MLGFKLFEYHDNKKIYQNFYCTRIIGDKQRLIEEPNKKLKKIQRKIVRILSNLVFPDYLMSVKGNCFIDSAIAHGGVCDHIIKIDISKFYPNTARDKIYKFWKKDMNMSSAVAELITNLTTVTTGEARKEVKDFCAEKEILYENHLPTGGPSSSILAYLVNRVMFDEIHKVVKQYNGIMTVYADDITISKCRTPVKVFNEVRGIIFHNGYRISNRKSSIKHIFSSIEINGLVHTRDGQTRLPNRICKRISELKKTENPLEKEELKGLILYKRQVKKKISDSVF